MATFVRRLAWAGVTTVLAATLVASGIAQASYRSPGPFQADSSYRSLTSPAHLSAGFDIFPSVAHMLPEPQVRGARTSGAAEGVQGQLFGVTAPSRGGAWAVGFRCVPRCASPTEVERTLIWRWNGRRWSTVPSPNPGANWDYLFSVSAISARDAWAVGFDSQPVGSGSEISATLILRWNGHAWSRIPSPNPSKDLNELDGVSAVSAKSAWAVGYDQTGTGGYEPLILHWNGTAWSRVPSPRASAFSAALSAVSAASSKSAWAVGSYVNASGVITDTLILRWDGTTWRRVRSSSPSAVGSALLGVSSLAPGRAWAVGGYCVSACGYPSEVDNALVLRWNGRNWSRVASPSHGVLTATSAISPASAWAVGSHCVSQCGQNNEVDHSVILRWNGHSWSDVPGPRPYSTDVLGIADASAKSAWAVGDAGTATVFRPLILRWNGKIWSLPAMRARGEEVELVANMGFHLQVHITAADVGKRVVIRWRRPGPGDREQIADVLGILEQADAESFAVRKRDGDLVVIPVWRALAGKVVPPRPERRADREPP
jgi:hypothetical protein